MRRKPRSPFPQRDGLDAVRLRTPDGGTWPTMRDHLVDRLPIAAAEVDRMLREQRVAGPGGLVDAETPFAPRTSLWMQRETAPEPPVPHSVEVLHRDADILVADKPHFLATTPRGGHITETALVRLRRELELPELSPAHRLDRMTAGLVLFTVRPDARREYQGLFQDRAVRKEYLAVARHDPQLVLPRTVRSRIVKERGVLQAQEVPGPPNSETRVELIEHRDGLGRYRLLPTTGRTHQLRVHLAALGVPIAGDDLYPQVRDRADDDFTDPLQLLASVLEFRDPRTGLLRRFETRRTLESWPAPR
ncbi:MAG: pseudouridylate synthase [Saccharopolyspora sp.]|uniref:pseudouridine synthase n=1 Tax=Saccharopolyspora TaxID=1835 RepID=UPI0019098C17|nr:MULTISPECIES: pseudouridine synthase [unclassified Saccharopolyspora]MBK0869477.1 pseudouridylate synthase [Saccharopolyspora sp. HNM0986]MBQ6644100.1 pseudouridylate synthase [Saccharopolyspora sp.]